MIVGITRGNIFNTPHRHIVFAVNTEGINDSGFAGQVSSKHWPKLASTGRNDLGVILTKEANGKVFHAFVCHSLGKDAWKKTPRIVEECLNVLEIPQEQILAVVLMGHGPVGMVQGADVFAILGAMARSNKQVEVYYL